MLRQLKLCATVFALAFVLTTSNSALAQTVTTAPEIKGEVTKVDLDKREFMLTSDAKAETRKDINFRLGEDASTYIDGKEAAFEDLKQGDNVKVEHYRQEGNNWYAIIIKVDRKTAATNVILAEEIRGQVTNVEPEKLEFTANTDLKKAPVNFKLGEDASIYINGAESSINELKAGDRINVEHFTQEGETVHAIIIRVDRK